MIDFRNEYIRRVLRAADTSGGQHPSGRRFYSAHRYALVLVFSVITSANKVM